jgi:hypothetical protein
LMTSHTSPARSSEPPRCAGAGDGLRSGGPEGRLTGGGPGASGRDTPAFGCLKLQFRLNKLQACVR